MNDELYDFLEKYFYEINHVKYRKYFKEWIKNITDNQIIGFTNMMFAVKNNTYIFKNN